MRNRNIIDTEASYILSNGYHETTKDQFDSATGNWKYAIRGNTFEGRDIRAIVAFTSTMMITTVIDKDN